MNHDTHNGHLDHPEVTFESRDLSARGVVGFLIGLAVVGTLMTFVIWGMYQYLNKFEAHHQRRLGPLEVTHSESRAEAGRAAQRFPSPRLQPDPVADLNKFRAHNEQVLNSYGWVDQKSGTVHIPIEKAMDMVVAQGLPTRQSGTQAKAAPGTVPNRSEGAK